MEAGAEGAAKRAAFADEQLAHEESLKLRHSAGDELCGYCGESGRQSDEGVKTREAHVVRNGWAARQNTTQPSTLYQCRGHTSPHLWQVSV